MSLFGWNVTGELLSFAADFSTAMTRYSCTTSIVAILSMFAASLGVSLKSDAKVGTISIPRKF